jgi:alpha-D-xyloside xylohydrolase
MSGDIAMKGMDVMKRHWRASLASAALMVAMPGVALAAPLAVMDRNGASVAVEPYAPGIVRVTIAMDGDLARAAPGEGPNAKADATGWTHTADARGDLFTSGAMQLRVNAQPWPGAPSMMERYFAPALPGVSISFARADGTALTTMNGWEMSPHDVAGEHTFKVGATFSTTADEHFWGLGQNQQGFADLRGRTIDCRHNYDAPEGESVCVPFMVTNKGYGIVWDNASATTVSPGVNGKTRWTSNVGERVSFFVITGKTTDDLYAGYARLTGATPLPPKAAFGLIQSKARYETQDELLGVARGYRERKLPLDVMVLDWFYWTRLGNIDIDRKFYPDPKGMNAELNKMGMHSLISVWPRFEKASKNFDMMAAKGWLLHDKNGVPADGLAVRSDRAGALIDPTIPAARQWFWGQIRDNILSQGFDWTWLDETEPDLVPDGYFYSIGSGDRYHNLFPLLHTSSVADGSAQDRPNKRNLILCRAAYLGAQRNGCLFWSSDVDATWEALRRQVPTGINAAASGMTYWSSDTGGWQWPGGAGERTTAPLVDPAGATAMPMSNPDYPELFIRWFQYNTFTPTLRVHGQRPGTALWEYGKAAEPILADTLRLRYALLPYTYAAGRHAYDTGAPILRGLFMDFGADAQALKVKDEYMFGPAFLVAPVTTQGQTQRPVYLPAGTVWYDWWSGQKYDGGQTITAQAPIAHIPLFVKAGSIVALGTPILSTMEKQGIAAIRVFAGADGRAMLYDDDGETNAYRGSSAGKSELVWSDAAGRLSGAPKGAQVEIVK